MTSGDLIRAAETLTRNSGGDWWSTEVMQETREEFLVFRCKTCKQTEREAIRAGVNRNTLPSVVNMIIDRHVPNCRELSEFAIDALARSRVEDAPRTNLEYAEAMSLAFMAVADDIRKNRS